MRKTSQPSLIRPPAINKKLTNQLFMRLGAIYGRKFISLYPNVEALRIAKLEWGSAILHLKEKSLLRALNSLSGPYSEFKHWPPTVGEFVSLALGEERAPTALIAFDHAKRKEFVHPASSRAYRAIGSWDFQTQKEEILRKRFCEYYTHFLREIEAEKQQIFGEENV